MFLLLDIGGTNTRIATASSSDAFTTPAKLPTPPIFSDAITALSAHILPLLTEQPLQGVIVGLPGTFNKTTGSLAVSPNLNGWVGHPIQDELENLTHVPVRIINDSALAGLGEACSGAGRGFDIVAYLTISTGVGGARIVNQKIDANTYGFEPGFHIIDASGTLCPDCHSPSSLEDLVGGASVAKRFKCHPKNITDPQVWSSLAQWLAYGLANISFLWSPSVIVLGGPMMRDIPLDQVIAATARLTSFIPAPPAIKPAALGDDRAFYGALSLIKDTLI
jgi:glucokinase